MFQLSDEGRIKALVDSIDPTEIVLKFLEKHFPAGATAELVRDFVGRGKKQFLLALLDPIIETPELDKAHALNRLSTNDNENAADERLAMIIMDSKMLEQLIQELNRQVGPELAMRWLPENLITMN